MLATIGLLFAGLSFIIFAITHQMWVSPRLNEPNDHMAAAYGLLGTAFAIWGVTTLFDKPYYLSVSVIAGETLIALASVSLLDYLVTNRWRTAAVAAAVVVFAGLMALRLMFLYPSPYMSNGILIFNIPTPVVLALGAVTLGIWLPASVKAARALAAALKAPELKSTYTNIYFATAIAALIFTGSRRPLTAALSFAALALMAVLLVGSNYMVKLIKDNHGRTAQ